MRIGKNRLLGLLFVSIVLLFNACVIVVKDNPNGYTAPHAASSVAYWYYYPNSQVYYHITEHYYYYRNGQRWIKATALPAGWVLNNSYRVRLRIAGNPYRQHAYYERRYPPRQRSAHAPDKGPHGDDHGKGGGLFGELTRLKIGPHNQQHNPEHANYGKGLTEAHRSEHVNRGNRPDKRHQPEYARVKGRMAPAMPNFGKTHGKPAKMAGAMARGQRNPGKGGSQNAKRPMGQQQPQGLQAKARHGQGGLRHTAKDNVQAKPSAPHPQRVVKANHSRDAATHKTASKTKMNPAGAHQNMQAKAHGNKAAANHGQPQKTAGMTSPRNEQQAATQHKASGNKQQAERKQAGKKPVAKGEEEGKAEKVLAANQEDGDSADEKPGHGKGKGR